MDIDLLLELLFILFLILMSGFFSGSETALTTASRPKMHLLEKEGNRKAKLVNKLRHNSEQLISTILLGNNLVNILGSALATSFMIRAFGQNGVLIATAVMTVLVLIFGEVLPKTYAINNSEKMAMFASPLINFFNRILLPFTALLQWVTKSLIRSFGLNPSSLGQSVGDEELRGAIEMHSGDYDAAHEKIMLRSILDLDEIDVSEIMVHRKNVEMLDVSLPAKKIIDAIINSNYTRIPIWKNHPDNIIGVLHAKALLRAIRAKPEQLKKIDILSLLSDPWFIPDTTNLLDQLLAFRKRKEHFANVVDEYGDFQGIVTLEDILEEIVGQIDDEHDDESKGIRRLDDGSFVVQGHVSIRDLNRELHWELPDEEASTVAGLLLHESQKIPRTGQTFRFHGFQFQVLRRQRHQITLLRLTPLTKSAQ